MSKGMIGDRKSRNGTTLFLVSLSAADLLLLLVCAPVSQRFAIVSKRIIIHNLCLCHNFLSICCFIFGLVLAISVEISIHLFRGCDDVAGSITVLCHPMGRSGNHLQDCQICRSSFSGRLCSQSYGRISRKVNLFTIF
jgi:hypothetical protein